MFKHLLLTLAVASTAGSALAQQAPISKAGAGVQAAGPAAYAHQRPGRDVVLPATPALNGSFSPTSSLLRNLQDAGAYKSFVLSAERSGLVELLQDAGPYTVFAPHDDAFGQLPAALLSDLWKPVNRARLYATMASHVVAGNLKEQDLTPGRVLTTVGGTPLTVRRVGGRLALEDQFGKRAYVATTNQLASNGTVHVLERVLGLP
ncbi:fasciclin domain-containing protein [Hymenobacter sp. 15J16-1T3B]|uniref:fasciclin domain-containing protein n=1 Tax=Hymenobacter sp. 15J16-1T3B TaxID=2886941 RepID=UPI001D105227|nr:fasciclin domain-containing protein [Hymenobacter sp. 15J16-1T3B]MCC3156658.1 fasciclin domain-containing protein [Hymenobacter sp. 15J16-1T3B]